MKKTKKQAERIIKNIFDIICRTSFEEQARNEMTKDLANKNISLDKEKGTIAIQNENGTIDQYIIKITF